MNTIMNAPLQPYSLKKGAIIFIFEAPYEKGFDFKQVCGVRVQKFTARQRQGHRSQEKHIDIFPDTMHMT